LSFNQPFSLVTSADGSKLIALDFGFSGYASTNYGITWTSISPPGNRAAISADGTTCYFVNYHTTNIYVSTNLGTTTKRIASPSVAVLSLAVSAAGGKLIAATFPVIGANPGPIYISTNAGISWIPTSTPATNWYFVGSSADGSRLIGASRGSGIAGPIYTSSDSGVTWVSNNVANQIWGGVASSADGCELLATAPFVGLIYISKSTPTPSMNIVPSSGNLALSWTLPSTNFVMQQSADLQNWADMTNQPVLNLTNLQNQVFLPPPGSNVFYRLKTP
jgi:hypothetical protein